MSSSYSYSCCASLRSLAAVFFLLSLLANSTAVTGKDDLADIEQRIGSLEEEAQSLRSMLAKTGTYPRKSHPTSKAPSESAARSKWGMEQTTPSMFALENLLGGPLEVLIAFATALLIRKTKQESRTGCVGKDLSPLEFDDDLAMPSQFTSRCYSRTVLLCVKTLAAPKVLDESALQGLVALPKSDGRLIKPKSQSQTWSRFQSPVKGSKQKGLKDASTPSQSAFVDPLVEEASLRLADEKVFWLGSKSSQGHQPQAEEKVFWTGSPGKRLQHVPVQHQLPENSVFSNMATTETSSVRVAEDMDAKAENVERTEVYWPPREETICHLGSHAKGTLHADAQQEQAAEDVTVPSQPRKWRLVNSPLIRLDRTTRPADLSLVLDQATQRGQKVEAEDMFAEDIGTKYAVSIPGEKHSMPRLSIVLHAY